MADETTPSVGEAPATETPQEPLSTRDVLEKAWDHLEKYEQDAQEKIEKGPETLPPDGGKVPTEAPRVRDTSGRFAPKPPTEKGSLQPPTPAAATVASRANKMPCCSDPDPSGSTGRTRRHGTVCAGAARSRVHQHSTGRPIVSHHRARSGP